MVLAHQYLGQLDPKLQEAFAANTSIKFAGGVSAKDARALASMMHTTPELIEDQPKLSFAAHIRGVNRQALPLKFPQVIWKTCRPWTGLARAAPTHARQIRGAYFEGDKGREAMDQVFQAMTTSLEDQTTQGSMIPIGRTPTRHPPGRTCYHRPICQTEVTKTG